MREEAPYLLIGSLPCTYFRALQELNKAVHGNKPGWTDKFDREIEKAIKHVEFCCAVYKFQIQQGRRFLHNPPLGSEILEIALRRRLAEAPCS